MNIQSSKIELVKTILDIDNKELTNKVAKFIQKKLIFGLSLVLNYKMK